MSAIVYHFTDTMRLPWIIEASELRAGANRVSALPFDFLWATTNPTGDRSSAAQASPAAREVYRQGMSQLVRFTLPDECFIRWRDVPRLYPKWSPDQIARTEKLAIERGETGFDKWRLRLDPLPVARALAIEAKSYASGHWTPVDATMKSCVALGDIDNGRGVIIGEQVYFSARTVLPGGPMAYANLGRAPLSDLKAVNC